MRKDSPQYRAAVLNELAGELKNKTHVINMFSEDLKDEHKDSINEALVIIRNLTRSLETVYYDVLEWKKDD